MSSQLTTAQIQTVRGRHSLWSLVESGAISHAEANTYAMKHHGYNYRTLADVEAAVCKEFDL